MSIGIGGSGGGCVLLARDASGSWSDPAFYTLSSGSIGIQLGMDDSQVMLFIMTDRGLQTLLDNQIQLGASAAASFATIGTGIEDGTAGRSDTDIMGLQKSKGLLQGLPSAGQNSPSTVRQTGIITRRPSARRASSSTCR
jgi:lipid-binding SYLF domain-containing protein